MQKKYLFIIILLFISIITHFVWFTGSILQSGDYIQYPLSFWLNKSNASMWSAFVDFGNINIFGWGFPHFALYGLMSQLHISQNISEKIITFVPSLLGGVFVMYILGIILGIGTLGSFLASLLFNFNTYFLVARDHIYIYSAEVASLWALLSYTQFISKKQFRYFILTFFALFYSFALDPRGALLGFSVFICYSYILNIRGRKSNKRFFPDFIVFGTLLLFSNMYWILPQYFAKSLIQNQILSRDLFGNQYWTIVHAFTLYHPFWTGGKPTWFTVQLPPLVFWAVAILFVINVNIILKTRKVFPMLFSGIALVGILLTKQVDIPFGGLYTWLFTNVPGFSAFRDASKFYYYIALGYAFTLGYAITEIQKIGFGVKKVGYYLLVFIVLLVSSLLPAAAHGFGKIGKLDVPADIPVEYLAGVRYVNAIPKKEIRLLLIPEYQGFIDASSNSPVVGLNYLKGSDWMNVLLYSKRVKNYGDSVLMNALASDQFENSLYNGAIGYIFVGASRKDISEAEHTYAIDFKEIHRLFDSYKFLEKVYSNPYATVYKVKNAVPRLRVCKTTSIKMNSKCLEIPFDRINESDIRFNGINFEGSYIIYSDSWNKNWKLIPHELSFWERVMPWTIKGIIPEKDASGFQIYPFTNEIGQAAKNRKIVLQFIPDLYRIHGICISVIVTIGLFIVVYKRKKKNNSI